MVITEENKVKILTGYFAYNTRHINSDMVPVSISLGTPRWFKGTHEMKSLAPSREILAITKKGGEDATGAYTEAFRNYLGALNREVIVQKIAKISQENGGAPVVLCCYEKLEDFCHRHIVADWLNEELPEGSKVEEFGFEAGGVHVKKYDGYEGFMKEQSKYWV
jgi:uncharacterized protein YeaO (DUF488 family)